MRIRSLTAVLSLLVSVPAYGQAPASGAVTVIRAARMVDSKKGVVVANPIVVVQGARITAVGVGIPIPAGATMIDLGDATILPGLIDSHTHLLQNYDNTLGGDDPNMALTVTTMSTAKRALLGAAMGREDLEAGITTVRDLGNSGYNGDVALRDAINAGWVVGPRIRASTRALSAAGGQFGALQPEVQKLIEQEYVVISGVEDARRAVRQAFYDGADLIKVIVNTGPRVVSLEEMKVIVEEAHRVNRTVAAHAIGDLPTRISAEAGVNSIEHAYTIPDDVLKMMAEKRIYLVPTDYPDEFYLPGNITPDKREQALKNINGFTKGSRDRLARAVKAGVPIAFGSDEYYQSGGRTRGLSTLQAMLAYAASGMTPMQIIQAATVNAADLAGWSDRVGALETGKFADIIAVNGDPTKDIGILVAGAKFVMKGGAIVKR
ncbi:MAG: amidohydrolase family protein [Gemmatimonadota bacterium]|nr:amidohydrolase family protein [Gemmatimonadota bacterium]